MKVLIKVGGTLLDHPDTRASIAAQLAQAAAAHKLVVVHGGGKQVTRFLEERGVQSRFVDGLRVSDSPVIDAVTQIIAGAVNKQFVASLLAAGSRALGLSGVDGGLTAAVPLNPELGFVGKPVQTEGRLFDLLLDHSYLPVVACIAGDQNGNIYNVNADQMAVSCAVGWAADALFFLTDVPGVKDRNGAVLPQLTPAESRDLISGGVAHGGMQAKLEAALAALTGGLLQVVIAAGHEPNICNRLFAGEIVGTRLAAAATPRQRSLA